MYRAMEFFCDSNITYLLAFTLVLITMPAQFGLDQVGYDRQYALSACFLNCASLARFCSASVNMVIVHISKQYVPWNDELHILMISFLFLFLS